MSDFVHLHLHTHYSFLDAMNRIPELMKSVKALGQDAVAVTEHGHLCSTPQFYKEARKHGVKPIIGCEVYVATGSHLERSPAKKRYFHLVLLVQNETGFSNLIKLVSKAHLDGFYYRPRCDHEILEQYNEGLICLSGCLSGEISTAIEENRFQEAEELAKWHRGVFGDRFYLEIQRNGLDTQDKVNEGLFDLAKKLKLPLVATNDCHYLRPEDARPHDILLCVGTGSLVTDQNRKRYGSDAFYLRSSEEMTELFRDHLEAVSNTVEIARRCTFEWKGDGFIFPHYEVPEGETLEGVLKKMSETGLRCRLDTLDEGAKSGRNKKLDHAEYKARLDLELDLITRRGFAGYLLIVQDFMNWARSQKIPVGPGRGSAAGSLVCYALGITDIDPIRYGLLFERFMNPERTDNPDIDCDFCANGRERVIEYVTQKYGKDNVCQIATFGTLAAKAAIKDVGRALGYPYNDVDRVSKMIPNVIDITIDRAIEEDSELRNFIGDNAWARELIDNARAVEGLCRQIGKHAAGVVIAPRPLTEFVPLTRDKDGLVLTQWDKDDVETAGRLIKFDFLGLKTLTVIDKTLGLVEKTHGIRPDMNAIPMDDPETFKVLAAGQTTGVFQLESRGMKELLVRLAPATIDEIIALVALYRPGPMQNIDLYIASKRDESKVNYELPVLKDILKETFGVMVYQEQVMQAATAVGGLSLGQSDLLRRAISKKKDVEKFRADFFAGAAKKGTRPDKIQKIWDQIEKFAEYGFNKSHSAVYGVVAYQTAWLKAHYPLEFLSALLSMDVGDSDKLYTKINEVRDMRHEVLPPDINRSERDFTVENGKIRFGLAGVKNVGEGTIEAILAARARVGAFAGLFHLLEEVDHQHVNKRVVESLVKAGCFDAVNDNRAQLLAGVDAALDNAARILRERESGQGNLFGGFAGNKPGPTPDIGLPDVERFSDNEMLENEKAAFGFCLTGHPLRQYERIIRKYTNHTCETLKDIGGRVDAVVAAVIAARRFKDTARGRMAILQVEDLTGTYEAVVYSEAFGKSENLLKSDKPLLLTGKAETSEKGPKIIVEEVFPLEQAERVMGSELHIRLPRSGVSQSTMEMLRSILVKAGRGSCRPVLHVPVPGAGEAVMKLPANLSVEPNDEVVAAIEQLLGRDVVIFS